MTILIYLSHPAQFHFFKFIISALERQQFKVLVVIKTKDVLEELVQEQGWNYRNIQPVPRKSGAVAIFWAMLQRSWRIRRMVKREKVDLLIGTDASIAHAAFWSMKKSITTLEDDYQVIKHLARLTFPFTTVIVVPACCDVGRWTSKKVGYQGYMKLAYLHPAYFRPSQEVLVKNDLNTDYVLIRLASLTAHHDKGIGGLTENLVEQLIGIIQCRGVRVCISSESPLPAKFAPFRLVMKANDMHHILAGARLLVSDSQSMSVEAAVLGVPSIRFSDFVGRISVLEELEHRYQLTFGVPTDKPDMLLETTEEVLKEADSRAVFQLRRERLLHDKIDVTAFMTDFIRSMLKM